MEIIRILKGTKKQFEYLYKAITLYDKDNNRIPEEVETRVYVIDSQKNINDFYTDEEFIEQAEEEGRVYTLQGFQEAFNLNEINSFIDVIRIINVPI